MQKLVWITLKFPSQFFRQQQAYFSFRLKLSMKTLTRETETANKLEESETRKLKLVWSPETASKAYIDTVRACEIYKESGVAELISAMAGGWDAKLIVDTWQLGGSIATSIGLAVASRHTSGRHVCVVPDDSSRSEYLRSVGDAAPGASPEVIVGEAEEAMGEPSLEGVDFLVVDCRDRDFSRVLRMARLSQRGAVLLRKNAATLKAESGFRWRSVLDASRYRVVRTAFLPVEEGLDIAHVGASGDAGGGGSAGRKRWVKHVDQRSGEEHVIRTSCQGNSTVSTIN